MNDLSRNEELILLSIWKLKDNAYGVTIRQNVMELSSKTLHYGSLYNTLDLLLRKGYVVSQKSDPVAQKGGRSKILYYLTRQGTEVLKAAQEYNRSLWNDVPDILFEG